VANIITDFSGDKRVVMTNARFAREPLTGFFTGWSKIRIALFLTITDSGITLTGTPRFAFGLCAGSTDIMGDTTTTHFCGMITNVANWTRAGSPPYFLTASMTSPAKKVGTTLTVGTAFGGGCFHTGALQMYFIDITKGSPNYSFNIFEYNSTTTPSVTLAQFLTQSVNAVPSFSNHVYPSAQTVAVDEATDGTFDHGCVWWDQAACNIQIAAWRMYRLA
jgi:hypothetical protein